MDANRVTIGVKLFSGGYLTWTEGRNGCHFPKWPRGSVGLIWGSTTWLPAEAQLAVGSLTGPLPVWLRHPPESREHFGKLLSTSSAEKTGGK
jgi:hypothetical protein